MKLGGSHTRNSARVPDDKNVLRSRVEQRQAVSVIKSIGIGRSQRQRTGSRKQVCTRGLQDRVLRIVPSMKGKGLSLDAQRLV